MAETIAETRVAVASSDGLAIDRHFGKANRFYVYTWQDDHFAEPEIRDQEPLCGEIGHGSNFGQVLDNFGDCRIVLANAAGPAVVQGLHERGSEFIPVEGLIVEALVKLAQAKQYRTFFIDRRK